MARRTQARIAAPKARRQPEQQNRCVLPPSARRANGREHHAQHVVAFCVGGAVMGRGPVAETLSPPKERRWCREAPTFLRWPLLLRAGGPPHRRGSVLRVLPGSCYERSSLGQLSSTNKSSSTQPVNAARSACIIVIRTGTRFWIHWPSRHFSCASAVAIRTAYLRISSPDWGGASRALRSVA